MFLIISSSLNPSSNSRKMGLFLNKELKSKNVSCDFLDLQNYSIPFCGDKSAYDNIHVKNIKEKILNAKTIVICSPIYNYDLSASIKNILELTGKAWYEKNVGFLCAAGGKSSYMSPMSFMNSMILDFRCLIIPQFVYALGSDFDESRIISKDIKERILSLANYAVLLNDKLR
ncbi:MAG: flavoprotein [Candidatus Marinimicrobia bacterium]|nr:flavoprotein [Candidatus Neomarinimicrobiota bacterium]